MVWMREGAVQPGFAATGPARFGSPTWLGRFRLLPFHWKFTPDAFPPLALVRLSTTKRGNPEVAFSMTSISQLPSTALTAPFQSPPYLFPLPNGRSYVTLAVNWWFRLSCERPQSNFRYPGSGK